MLVLVSKTDYSADNGKHPNDGACRWLPEPPERPNYEPHATVSSTNPAEIVGKWHLL